jgi:gas vesicle protein
MDKWIPGFLLGAVAGAVAGALLAPQSGNTLQSALSARMNAVIEEGRRAAAERRAELEAQFAEAKRAKA